MRALVRVATPRGIGHDAAVRKLGFWFPISIVVVASGATGCASHGNSSISSSTPPPVWALELCDAYSPHVNRTAANVSATTAGAVADSLRAARLKPAPWGSRPRNEQVARCEYPANAVTTPTTLVRCPKQMVAVVPDPTLYFWMNAHGTRTAIPDAVLGPPCDRT